MMTVTAKRRAQTDAEIARSVLRELLGRLDRLKDIYARSGTDPTWKAAMEMVSEDLEREVRAARATWSSRRHFELSGLDHHMVCAHAAGTRYWRYAGKWTMGAVGYTEPAETTGAE